MRSAPDPTVLRRVFPRPDDARREDEPDARPLPLWPKLLAAFALAGLAVVLIPRAGSDDGSVPGLSTLLATGAVVALLTTGAFISACGATLDCRRRSRSTPSATTSSSSS